MTKGHKTSSPGPTNAAHLIQSASSSGRDAVAKVHALLKAAERVLAAATTIESTPTSDAMIALRRALNELHAARRALDAGINDLMEFGDRVLDAFDAQSRHLLKSPKVEAEGKK